MPTKVKHFLQVWVWGHLKYMKTVNAQHSSNAIGAITNLIESKGSDFVSQIFSQFTQIFSRVKCCFGQFYQSKIEVLQNCSAFFVSVSLMTGKIWGNEKISVLENSGHSPCISFPSHFTKYAAGLNHFLECSYQISSIKNWSFAKLISFFCLSFTHDRKIWGSEIISFLENSGHSPCYFISIIFYKVRSGFKSFFGVQLPNFKALKKQ